MGKGGAGLEEAATGVGTTDESDQSSNRQSQKLSAARQTPRMCNSIRVSPIISPHIYIPHHNQIVREPAEGAGQPPPHLPRYGLRPRRLRFMHFPLQRGYHYDPFEHHAGDRVQAQRYQRPIREQRRGEFWPGAGERVQAPTYQREQQHGGFWPNAGDRVLAQRYQGPAREQQNRGFWPNAGNHAQTQGYYPPARQQQYRRATRIYRDDLRADGERAQASSAVTSSPRMSRNKGRRVNRYTGEESSRGQAQASVENTSRAELEEVNGQ